MIMEWCVGVVMPTTITGNWMMVVVQSIACVIHNAKGRHRDKCPISDSCSIFYTGSSRVLLDLRDRSRLATLLTVDGQERVDL
jgi:hypothetical protein